MTTKGSAVKYVLLIYQPPGFDPKSLPPEEHAAIAADYQAVSNAPNVTSGPPLGASGDALTVRVTGEGTSAVAGPYNGEAGAVGGFLTLEADNDEEAVLMAARVPAARLGGAVEVRRCGVYW